MARVETQSTQTDSGSPIDVSLMDQGLRLNDNDHESRIIALEAAGGGGTGAIDTAALATINSGLVTNDPKFFRLRYSPFQSVLASGEKIDEERTGFDPEGKLQSRWVSNADNDTGNTRSALSNHYQGQTLIIAKNNKVSFKLKKGENYFGIGSTRATNTSDSVTVTVDGVAIVTAGILNENGVARTDTYSTVTSTLQFQQADWFFGGLLDPNQEQLIVVENTDSGTDVFEFDYLDTGFRSPDGEFVISTEEPLHISDGVATIRGQQISYNESNLTLDNETGGGRTDAIIGDQSQVLSILKGDSPAMTQAMPTIALDWEAGFTSLRCKNTSLFPSKGFLLISQPWGQHFIASYTSKVESLINTHQFAGMLFSSTSQQNWTPLTGFGGASGGGAADFFGDLNVNLWGSNGLQITSSNNKIDFKITINGTETTHVATLAVGLYAANGPGKLDLGSEIIRAMNAIKDLSSIGGNYFAEYDNQTQKWIIGATGGGEIDAIDFDFSSGPNVSNSIHTDIGFPTTNIADNLTYIATTIKQHEMANIFQEGDVLEPSHPNIKINAANSIINNALLDDAKERLGLANIYTIISQNPMIKIYVDSDTCGLACRFLNVSIGGTLTYQVDNGQFLYLQQLDRPSQTTSTTRASVNTAFLSFPRGSKTITIRQESGVNFEIDTGTNTLYFVNVQQYHTRPPLEVLPLNKSAIKVFNIAPKQVFLTYYAAGGASFYSPGANDSLDTVSFTGSWSSSSQTTYYNGSTIRTSTLNDTADFTFTTTSSVSGISVKTIMASTHPREIEFYLIDGSSASETNSLIQVVNLRWSANYRFQDVFTLNTLPAGQYTLRVKQKDSSTNLDIMAVGIFDDEPEANKNTISDLSNNLQAIAFPVHTVNLPILQDGIISPGRLDRTGYNEGRSVIDYSFSSPAFNDRDETSAIVAENSYYGAFTDNGAINDFVRSFSFCKSYAFLTSSFTTRSITVQAVIDGVNSANTFDAGIQTKAGSAPSSIAAASSPLFQKNFFLLGSNNMSNSTTFLIGDTRGLRVGQKVIVKATGQTTLVRFITSISADTNIVFKAISAFASYTTANSTSITFGGFHTLRHNNDNAASQGNVAFLFEPLDIVESNFIKRALQNKKTETANVQFNAVVNGDDLYYPTFSDGTSGNWRNSSIQVIGTLDSATTYSFPENLRDIAVSASDNIDVKITSTKEVSI